MVPIVVTAARSPPESGRGWLAALAARGLVVRQAQVLPATDLVVCRLDQRIHYANPADSEYRGQSARGQS